MQSKAATVDQYLAELPPDRREALTVLRRVILKNLPKGYEEGMGYGMMGYFVPHSLYPPGYHCDPSKPLPFAGLASQKQYISFYLMSLYGPEGDEPWFRDAWAATGKKLDMGKCCVRFKRLDDAALDVIGQAIRRMPVDRWIQYYEASLLTMNKAKARRAQRNKAAKTAKKPAKTAKKSTSKAASRR